MSEHDHQAALRRAVEAFNRGDFDAVEAAIAPEFYSYAPQPDEQTASEVFGQIGRELRAAFPDLQLSLTEVTGAGEEARGRMTLHGTHTRSLWGLPPSDRFFRFAADAVFRFTGDRLAVAWPGANPIPLFREIGLIPPPEAAHKRPAHPVRLPEIFLRLAFNGFQLQEKPCTHLALIQVTEPSTNVCEACVASGDEWPALRMCMVCGFVGCCDLAVGKHARKHYEATGHPIFRSIAPGERWRWCYADSAFLISHE